MLLQDKKILVCGVANHRSIAYGVAQFCVEQGAQICLTYQNERLRKNAEKLADKLGDPLILPCDVGEQEQVDQLYARLDEVWGGLDGLVHSIAFANQEDLTGEYVNTSREGFLLAHDVSSYSLTLLARGARPLMQKSGGGSIVCMTYLGGERVVQNYNVMGVAKASLDMSARYLAANLGPDGIRVNILSPGPIRTLAASGVGGFKSILEKVASTAPLRRNVTQEDVGKAAGFLLSDLSGGITAETIHVDAGYNAVAL